MKLASSTNLICASLLTGVYDVNRNQELAKDNFEAIRVWYDSVKSLGLSAVIFHNNFSSATESLYTTDAIGFLRVDFDTIYNPNIYRYFIYKDFLESYQSQIDNVFVTDITDVEVLKNPFEEELFLERSEALFCGDEPKKLDNEWMNDHSTHLRNNIDGFAEYEKTHQQSPLLNCGIIGGNVATVLRLMTELVAIHRAHAPSNRTAYTLDMGAFNYAARTLFGDNIAHGSPVNTVFKGYETERKDCWFRHK